MHKFVYGSEVTKIQKTAKAKTLYKFLNNHILKNNNLYSLNSSPSNFFYLIEEFIFNNFFKPTCYLNVEQKNSIRNNLSILEEMK